MTVMFDAEAQRMSALQLANEKRLAAAKARREMAAGDLSLEDALYDPRCGPTPLHRVLAAQRRWGPYRTERLCRKLRINPGRKVRTLTDNEKAAVVAGYRDLISW
jgi:hypothetical protein